MVDEEAEEEGRMEVRREDGRRRGRVEQQKVDEMMMTNLRLICTKIQRNAI